MASLTSRIVNAIWEKLDDQMDDIVEKVIEKFIEKIVQKISLNVKRMRVNKLERKLKKTIWKSAKDHIGNKKITQHTKAWMTPEIKESIKKRII